MEKAYQRIPRSKRRWNDVNKVMQMMEQQMMECVSAHAATATDKWYNAGSRALKWFYYFTRNFNAT